MTDSSTPVLTSVAQVLYTALWQRAQGFLGSHSNGLLPCYGSCSRLGPSKSSRDQGSVLVTDEYQPMEASGQKAIVFRVELKAR